MALVALVALSVVERRLDAVRALPQGAVTLVSARTSSGWPPLAQ